MNVFSMLRQGAAAAVVAGVAAGFALGVTAAEAATIGFNYADGSQTVVTLGGSGPATLNFALDFGAAPGQSVGGDGSEQGWRDDQPDSSTGLTTRTV